jgi:hypothetical protein
MQRIEFSKCKDPCQRGKDSSVARRTEGTVDLDNNEETQGRPQHSTFLTPAQHQSKHKTVLKDKT